MPIINATKNAVLAEQFEECRSFWEQTRGMMFRKEVIPLVFVFQREQVVSLHSWFCPGPIDLVFLDETWEVVELKSEWERYSSYTPSRPFMFLLELPVGTIAQSRTEVGDVVQIKREISVLDRSKR